MVGCNGKVFSGLFENDSNLLTVSGQGGASIPSGYTINIDQPYVNYAIRNDVTFTFSNAEIGAAYNYTVTSSGGGTPVTGSGTITSATQQVAGIQVATLPDGNLTISVTLTNSIGTGSPAQDVVFKDALAPTNQDTVFSASSTVGISKTVAIVSSGDANNQVWLAPLGTTVFTNNGTTMTRAASGTATSITSPSQGGDYRLYLIDEYGNISDASLAVLTVDADPPTGVDSLFPADVTETHSASVSLVNPGGDATNWIWFAPAGLTNETEFILGSTMSRVAGDATSIPAPSQAGGPFYYRLYIIDQAGNVSSQSTHILTVDDSSVIAALSGQPTGLTNVTTLTVTVTGNITNYQYKVVSGTDCGTDSTGYSAWRSKATPISGSFSVSDGTVTLCAVGEKDGTTYQPYTSPTSVSWTQDTLAPSNANTVFASSAISKGSLDITIVSSGDSTNEVWFAPNGTVSFSESATMTKAASGTSTTIKSPSNDGTYYIYVIDAAGNVSVHSVAALTVDNTAPTDQNTVFSANQWKQGGNSVTLNATTTEAEVWFAPVGTTTFTKPANGSTMTMAAGSAGSIAAPTTAGSYRLYVIDAAGNVSSASVAVLMVDNTAPTLSSVSPASSAIVNNKNVSYTLSESSASGYIRWEETGGANDPAGTPAQHTYTMSGSDLNSGVHNLTLSALSLNSGTEYSVEFSATDAAGNNGTATSTFVTYNTGATTLSISSAYTMDADNDGKIDYYKITFNDDVNDSTFPGYTGANTLGVAQTDWTIAGYSGVVLAPGTTAPETDLPNVIYLKFTEGAGYDTGAKPDLTTSATPGLKSTSNVSLAQVFTPNVNEADGAKPIVAGASGTTTYSALTVAFSEAVFGSTANTACTSGSSGDMVAVTLAYTNGNGAGAASISGMDGSDNCACDAGFNAVYTTDASFISGDTADSVYASANVYDAADNTGNTTTIKTLNIVAATVPLITKIETFDSNNNGKIEQLKITFNRNMDDSTIDKADAARFTINTVAAEDVDSVTSGTGTISSPNNDPGVANDTAVTIFTDDTTVTGTGALAIAFAKATGRWRASGGAELESATDLSAFIVDKAPPVLLSAVAYENTNVGLTTIDSDDTIVLTFSEPTNKVIFNTATVSSGYNLDTVFQLSGGHTWGSPDAITSAVWNGAGDQLTISFSGGGTTPANLAPGDTIIIIGTSMADTAPIPNVSTNIAAREAISGSFVTDAYPPYMLSVYNIRSNSITVQFSEPMLCDGSAHAINTIANYTVRRDPYGSPTTLTISSIDVVSSSAVQLNFSTTLANLTMHNVAIASGRYVVDQASPSPNQIVYPTNLDFIVNEQLKVVNAAPITQYSVRLYFNKIPKAGNDVTGSAGCTTAAECNKRYAINPTLGNITQAIVGTGVLANTVTITHTIAQEGKAYTVIAANGITGDGFNNLPTESIRNVDDTENVQAMPKDRAGFTGLGSQIDDLSDGEFFFDPFVDGSAFSYTFTYGDRVYLGTNDTNRIAYRFDPAGTNAVTTTFAFSGGTYTCVNSDTFGYGAAATCGTNMGYNSEAGVAGFTSLNLTIGGTDYEMLMVGPRKSGIKHGYFTQDLDTILNWTQFSIQSNAGANALCIHTMYAVDNHLYVAVTSDQTNFAPQVGYHTVTASSGVLSVSAPTDMDIWNVGTLGKKKSNPATSAAYVGIESIVKFGNYLYMANNGGIYYSDNAGTPVFDATFKTYAVSATPSGWSGTTLVLRTNDKINPGSKGVPVMKAYNGKLYVIRNVAQGTSSTLEKANLQGEFWVCNPATSGNTLACDTGDWTRLVTGAETDLGPGSNSFSMFEINGEYAYLGVDNATTGGRVFRMKVTNSSHVPIDISATNGSTMTSAGWASFVILDDAAYPHILSSTTISDGTSNFIYITAGYFLSTTPIKVFRQKD